MGRTLRGFETEFPYLGARGDTTDGDVPDPGLIAKEEAYGGMYFHIGQRVADEMFGADDEDEDDFGAPSGAAGAILEHRYGAQAPAGFTFGPMGELVRTKNDPKTPQSPEAAARAAEQFARHRSWKPTIANQAIWDITGSSWQVGLVIPVHQQSGIDRAMEQIAKAYNVFLFKAQAGGGGDYVSYVFSMSPRSAPIGGRVTGLTLKPLSRPA